MRKKYTDEVYLKGVSSYKIFKRELKENNAYIVLKKIIKIDKPFVKNLTLIDDGYYIMEYTPMDKLYNARAFINKDLKTISYYFDISLKNGCDEGKPYYDDLFLDIIYGIETNNIVKVLDEEELLNALVSGQITKQNYDLANKVCQELVKEIQENKNWFINTDKKILIESIIRQLN